MRHIIPLISFVLTLACATPALAPSVVFPSRSAAPGMPQTSVEMIVIADTLNIRAEANANSAADYKGLDKGDTVTVYLSCTGHELREWAAINRDCTQWVKSSWLKMAE